MITTQPDIKNCYLTFNISLYPWSTAQGNVAYYYKTGGLITVGLGNLTTFRVGYPQLEEVYSSLHPWKWHHNSCSGLTPHSFLSLTRMNHHCRRTLLKIVTKNKPIWAMFFFSQKRAKRFKCRPFKAQNCGFFFYFLTKVNILQELWPQRKWSSYLTPSPELQLWSISQTNHIGNFIYHISVA